MYRTQVNEYEWGISKHSVQLRIQMCIEKRKRRKKNRNANAFGVVSLSYGYT